MSPPSPRPADLLVRMPKPLGDYVMATVALRLLHGHGVRLQVIGVPALQPLLWDLPLRFDSIADVGAVLRQARASGLEEILLLSSSFRSALQSRLAGLRPIGVRRDLRSWLLVAGVDRNLGEHKVEEYLRLGQVAALRQDLSGSGFDLGQEVDPRITVRSEDAAEARRRLEDAGVVEPYLLLCPTVAARHGEKKRWPGFAELYRRLEEAGRLTLTCPGPGEEEACRRAGARGVILDGVKLGPLTALLAGATTVVSNDTGVVHLAAATGVSTLGIYGDTDPLRYGPRGARAEFLGRQGEWPSVEEVMAWIEGRRDHRP